jgi:two-component system response regulator AtoC
MPETLLIIEDEQLLGTELMRHFRHADWEVVWARTFRDARRHLIDRELDPLVVLSDISLPDGNGLDLLDEVRQRGGRGEWVLLTARCRIRCVPCGWVRSIFSPSPASWSISIS